MWAGGGHSCPKKKKEKERLIYFQLKFEKLNLGLYGRDCGLWTAV